MYDYVIIELCNIFFLLVKCNLIWKQRVAPLFHNVYRLPSEGTHNYIQGHSDAYCCLLDTSKTLLIKYIKDNYVLY